MFYNYIIDKGCLKKFIVFVYCCYGFVCCLQLVDELKELGFCFVIKVGVFISVDDLIIFLEKK